MRVLDTNLTFAVRCESCGRIRFHSISTFQLSSNSDMEFNCCCGSKEITISLRNNKNIVLNIPCLACDINHTYKYSLKEVLNKRLKIVCCSETGLELCFLGREGDVRNIVSKYQEDLNLLLGELGLFEGLDDDGFNFKKHV